MDTSTPTANTPIIDIADATGFFTDDDDGRTRLYLIRWNKTRTARYALEVLPPHDRDPERTVGLAYRRQAPLRILTAGDRLPLPDAFRTLALHAPYDTCMFCHRPLDDDLTRTFGLGRTCATNHLGVTRKALELIYHRTGPTGGPGTPVTAPARGHLRLVAAYGRLLAA